MAKVDMPYLGIDGSIPAAKPAAPHFETPVTTGNVGANKPAPAPIPFDQPAVGGTTSRQNTGGGSMSGTPKM
jgi:hypothetical protein